MAELTKRRVGMQIGDIVTATLGPLVAQRQGAGSKERSTLIGVVKESVSQGKWMVLFTGESEPREMDKRNLRLEQSRGTIVEDRGDAAGAAFYFSNFRDPGPLSSARVGSGNLKSLHIMHRAQ